MREDTIFAALRKAVTKSQAREARKNAWILAATWRLVDKRVSAHRDLAKDQALIWRLGRAISASLTTDRIRQAEEVGVEVEALLGLYPPLHREAWHRIKVLYKAVVDHALSPAWVTLKRITEEGWNCTVMYHPRRRTSPFPCSRYQWMTRFLQRTR